MARARRFGTLKRIGADRFLAEFATFSRPGKASLTRMFRSPDPVVVDGELIAQALLLCMDACPFRSPTGAPQPWNEYRVFLARPDLDLLRPIEANLHEELASVLYRDLVEKKAVPVGDVVIRLLPDDENSVEPGTAVLHPRHEPHAAPARTARGEITVRLDKPDTTAGGATQRHEGVRLVTRTGSIPLPEHQRVIVGRAFAGAPADHLALPGATDSVSRRHVILLLGAAGLDVTRHSDANPVSVNGKALVPGESTTVSLPAELTLAAEFVVQVSAS